MIQLGFEYKERKKSYFSDKHVSEENVHFCKKIIEEYFKIELYTYRWVHLEEKVAKEIGKKRV